MTPEKRQHLVLIADDDPDFRMMCAGYLEARGYLVMTAEDGARAFDRARSESPDVIVMDLAMPRMDGWAAIPRLKAAMETWAIPIIAISGVDSVAARVRALGCSAFLAKPCLPELLLWQIRTLLPPA